MTTTRRRDFLKRIALGTLGAALSLPRLGNGAGAQVPGSGKAAAGRPNILVILADDLGRGDYSAFGTPDIRTPHIDRLCREGLTFDNFFANSPVCSPSRAALLTGCHPDRVGVPGVIRDETPEQSWGWLAPHAVLLPQALKPAGYHSALIGKWHLGLSSPNTPNERGFDLFHGFLGDMMDDYWTHRRHGLNLMRHNTAVIEPQGHATDVFTGWACEHLDDGIGQVLATLDRTGLAANTLVIFTSDNGGVLKNGANNGPWRSEKCHVYEGGLRVPGAARWPGVIQPGRTTGRFTQTMDIFATACAVAGVTTPTGIDAVSFLPTLRGEAEPAQERDYYFVRREGGPAYGGKTIEALRRGDLKVLQDSPFEPREMYDLKSDPLEATNLVARQRKQFNELSAALRKQVQRGGAVPWQAPAP